jgi:hypothetical protein
MLVLGFMMFELGVGEWMKRNARRDHMARAGVGGQKIRLRKIRLRKPWTSQTFMTLCGRELPERCFRDPALVFTNSNARLATARSPSIHEILRALHWPDRQPNHSHHSGNDRWLR